MDQTEAVFDALVGATEEYALVCREYNTQAKRLSVLPLTPQLLRDADYAVSRTRATLFNALDANKRGDPDDAVIGFGKAAVAQAVQAHEIIQRLHNIQTPEQSTYPPSPAVLGTPANPAKEQPVVR